MNTLVYKSEDELKALVKKSWLLTAIYGVACIFLYSVLFYMHCYEGTFPTGTVVATSKDILGSIIVIFFTAALIYGRILFSDNLDSVHRFILLSNPLTKGTPCIKLAELIKKYPSVATYISKVNQHRAVTQYDYKEVILWEKNEANRFVEERQLQACKEVNGILLSSERAKT